MIDEEEKKKRMERAKQIAHSINQNNYSSNFNNIALNRIKANTEQEKAYIDKFQKAREITNSINPRENVLPTTVSEEDKIKSQQNAQKFLDLIDNNVEEKQTSTQNLEENLGTIPKIEDTTRIKSSSQERKNQIKNKEELDKQIAEANSQNVTTQTKQENSIIDKDIKIGLANQTKTQNTKELSTTDIKIMKEANKKNKNLEQDGIEKFNEWADTVLNNVFGGVKQAVSGFANVVTTLAGLGVKGLSGASKIVGLNDISNSLDETYNKIIDTGSSINETANIEKNINSQVNNDFIKTSGEISNVISNMLGNAVIGYATGINGSVAQGLSVGGNSAQQVLDENKDNIGQATLTGIAKGYTSYLTEKMFDANILTKGSKKTSIQQGINKLISKNIDSKLGKEIANRTVGIIGENLEELAEDNAGYLIDKLINNKDLPSFEQWWNSTTETAKITTLSTMIMGLLGLGGSNFKDIEMDMETEYWVNQAQQIIEQEDLAIHFNSSEVKTIDTMQDFYISKFTEDGELINILPTKGKEINNSKPELSVAPVVIKDNQTNYYTVIDGHTGVVLDNTPYSTIIEAEGGFNEKANKLTDLQIKDINNKISKADYVIKNNIISMVREAQNQLNSKTIANNDFVKTNNNNKNINNTNSNTHQNYLEQSTITFYNNETKYAVPDIKKITEPFNAQQEYTKEEMADVWNDEISENEYDVTYDDNNNIQSYIAIEEDGNNLVVNQYDNEDNLIKSEVIPVENGKYNAETIKNTIEKVSRVYDENKPINGQVDIEGNEVRSMRKENNKKISPKRYNQIRDIVKYNQDGKEIKDNNYVDFIVERYKNNINISNIETNTQNIEQLLNETLEEAKNIVGVDNENKIKNKQKELMINNLYPTIKDTEFLTIKNLQNTDGTYATKKLNIEISKGGLKESFNKSISKEKYAVIPFLDILIKTSNDGIIRAESKDRRNISEWYYLYNTAIVNGKLYSVKIDIKKTTQGDKFYVHRLNIIKEGSTTSVSIVEDDTKRSNLKPSNINNSISQNQKSVKNDTIINNKSIQNKENNTTRAIKKQNGGLTKTQYDSEGREITFKQSQYFKESKVRDENGNLLVVYHGSTSEFTIFDAKKSGQASKESKVGFWFTETKEGAENFANSLWYGDKKAISYETYLNIKNPKVYNSIDNSIELENIDNRMKEQKNIIRKLENKNIAIEMNKQELKWATSKEELQEIAKIEGIDFEDAERYHNAIKKYNDLEEEYDNKKYGDSYEQFRTDIYKIANKSASDANFGGTGMWLENENEIISKFKQQLIDDGYDGIIIKNTKYDSDTMGRDNNQYVAFYPEQIKKVDNTNPTSNEDIRFAKRTAKSQDKTQRNAERGESYIEQEIKKIEATGNWDNSIPVTKMSDIRKTIENYLGLGIKKGHFRQQAYAIYKGNRDVIRTKELKDMDSILHETGHALDLGNRLNIDKESIADELLTAIDKLGGYEGETRTIRLEEGFAEVIREYTIIPEQAKIEYPQTVAVIQKIRQNDKSFDNFISKVQQQTYNYIHQNPRNRALSNNSTGEQTDKQPLTKNWIKQEVMRNVYDKDYALKSGVATLQEVRGKTVNQLKASDNAYYLTRLASGLSDKVISMLSDGYIDENGNKLMPGLNRIGEILENNPERFNDLRAYLIARRDTDYKSKKLKTGIRSMDSKAVIEQFKNDVQIQEAAQIIYDTLDGVLQYAVNNGLIAQETVKTLKESNAFYVPMQRVLENKGNNVGRRGAVADIIKRRTGSELDIKDVLENIITNSSNIICQVENNNVLKALYRQGEASGITGKVYDVITTPMIKIGTAKLSTWETELNKQGVDTNNLDLEKTIDLFVPNTKIDVQNKITSFIDDSGKRIYLQFNDELVFNSVMNMDKQFMSSILKITNKLNMPLRYGATMANLGFAIPNMISDTVQATIFSTAGFVPVVDNALGVLDILATTNKHVRSFVNQVAPEYANKINYLYTIYQQTGATSATRLSQYRKSTQKIMKNVYGTNKSQTLGIQEKFKPLKRLLDIMTYIPEISEQSTRFRVFEKNYKYYLKKGNSETDARILAALESRDATQDFGRTGNVTREINQLIPFSAARVGSAYTFAEKIKANPKQVSMRIAILTALAMTIKAIGYDDEEIQELHQRKKDDNFVFKIGDSIVTIKKPQGILRSIINLAEYIQDLSTGNIEEGKEAERLGEWLKNAIMDNMPADQVTGSIPNPITPLIENAINKDFYYNTEIVKNYDEQNLPDYQQYYDYNSQLAIWLGQVFNYSPAKIDNAISGWFGGLGTQVTDIIDWGLSKIGVIPEQPEMGAEDNAVGKRFFVNVNSNSSSVDEIYDRKTELTKMKNDDRIIMSQEEIDELNNIEDAISNISKLNKQIKEIKKDLSMSGKEKAEKIKLLQQEKTDTARKALGKEVIYPENEAKIQSTQFYPNDTLKKSGYTLTLSTDQKKEYEQIANSYYSKYERQGLYSEEKLEDIKSKTKEYAKNEMFKKYKSDLIKTKK